MGLADRPALAGAIIIGLWLIGAIFIGEPALMTTTP
jgi:hypothetical protein